MSVTESKSEPLQTKDALLSEASLAQLAARVRACGLFLMKLTSAGEVSFADSSADGFFIRFVLPWLKRSEATGTRLQNWATQISATRPLVVIGDVPGVSMAVLGICERKHVQCIIALAGKSADFFLSEDVLRACGQLALDGKWLDQRGSQLPGYGQEAIRVQANVVADALRDHLRIDELQSELDSLSGQLSNSYEELSLIYQLSSGMKVTRRPNDFFKECCLDVMGVLGVRGMGVALAGESFKQYAPEIFGSVEMPAQKVQRLADALLVELRLRKAAILCNDLAGDSRFSWVSEFARQMIAVPLMRDDHVLGCLFAFDVEKDVEGFDTVDAKLLTSIANESSIYLENAMLFDDVRGLMMGLLRSLTSAVDAKDAYTCGHSERVALLSRYIATQAGLSEAQVERIYMAGLLHDVGKIGVPEAVLQKAGRLDPAEFELIKKHPEIGARILRDVKQIQDIIPGVLHHHERYDGKGYPLGLAGENISLMGRIICLADCFDAMTSSRTYRKALPLDVVLTEIRRCGGSQFDPTITEAFLKIEPEKLMELLKDHREQMMRYSEASQLRVA